MNEQQDYTRIVIDGYGDVKTFFLEYFPSYLIREDRNCPCICWSHEKPKKRKPKRICRHRVLKGLVLCEFDGAPVPGAIVVATRKSDGKTFTSITNQNGEYALCLLANQEYTLEAFLCNSDCCMDHPCLPC